MMYCLLWLVDSYNSDVPYFCLSSYFITQGNVSINTLPDWSLYFYFYYYYLLAWAPEEDLSRHEMKQIEEILQRKWEIIIKKKKKKKEIL